MATNSPILDRITSIDALRGLALFGVLLINIETGFRGPMLLHGGTPAPGTADAIALRAIQLLVEGKSIAIFSMLFGVGLAIQHESLSRRGADTSYLVRRLGLLFLFGVAHLLIWSGDVLTVYAVAGLLSLPLLLRSRTSWLLPIAAVTFIAGAVLPLISWHLPMPDRAWMGAHLKVANDILANGTFAQISEMRWQELPIFLFSNLFLAIHTVALVLIGIWAWQSGLLLPGADKTRILRRAAWPCIPLGAVLTLINDGWPVVIALPSSGGRLLGDLAPLILALGYVAATLLFLASLGLRFAAFIAPMGRMAFTNYLSQTVIMAILFYGYGLGLSGKLGVIACFAIAITIFVLQLAWSHWWLSRHRFGPLEWLWRSGMYGRWQQWPRA